METGININDASGPDPRGGYYRPQGGLLQTPGGATRPGPRGGYQAGPNGGLPGYVTSCNGRTGSGVGGALLGASWYYTRRRPENSSLSRRSGGRCSRTRLIS